MAHRIGRVNEEIRAVLAALLPTVKDPRVPEFISVTEVQTTPDLKQAKVFVSVISGEEKEVLKGLKSSAGYLRRALAGRLNLRYTPELFFYMDGSIKEGLKINQILTDIAKKEEEK
ncbi:MAG: 30S ribosome-binding factor RbfA [Clostridia bacterium]|nr:30S ribosome-binding factor RbfA [Clostridia bacterium]